MGPPRRMWEGTGEFGLAVGGRSGEYGSGPGPPGPMPQPHGGTLSPDVGSEDASGIIPRRGASVPERYQENR